MGDWICRRKRGRADFSGSIPKLSNWFWTFSKHTRDNRNL